MITQAEVKRLFRYEPESGRFVRLVSTRGHNSHVGAMVGASGRYAEVWIRCERYLAHRLAWLYMTGEWPKYIDHINRDKRDNRWCNLREVDHTTNMHNRLALSNNKSGYQGVSKASWGFQAVIYAYHKRTRLGIYPTAIEAHAAYLKAKKEFHLQAPSTASSSAV